MESILLLVCKMHCFVLRELLLVCKLLCYMYDKFTATGVLSTFLYVRKINDLCVECIVLVFRTYGYVGVEYGVTCM